MSAFSQISLTAQKSISAHAGHASPEVFNSTLMDGSNQSASTCVACRGDPSLEWFSSLRLESKPLSKLVKVAGIDSKLAGSLCPVATVGGECLSNGVALAGIYRIA
jgi:hypothetical protein